MEQCMDVVIALDVSTSVIGWAVLPTNADATTYPLIRGHVDLRKNDGGFWAKVDQMELDLDAVFDRVAQQHDIVRLCIEDPVERFRNGLSSAHTIALLARFNALTSRHARNRLNLDPLYIDATAARKAIGVPLLSKKKSGGVDQKTQCFNHLCTTVFINESWPRNRNGKIQPWCMDEVDAYVICLAGCLGLGSPA
jgi:hypothetical protein